MRWKAVAGFCVLVTSLVVSASAQERLGDIAGSMKLKRDGGQDVVIDSQSSMRSGRSGASRSEGSYLKQVVEGGLEDTKRLVELLEEGRTPGVFADEGWRERIEEADMNLSMSLQDLMGIRPGERNEAAYDLAVQGMERAVESSAVVRDGIARSQLRITEPKEQLEENIQLLERVLNSIGVVLREEQWEAAAPSIDPVTAAATIKAFCGGKYAEGSQQYEDCSARQDAAYRSCYLRNPLAVNLQTAEFNTIRNGCRFEWPNDYTAQNRCEIALIARLVRQP